MEKHILTYASGGADKTSVAITKIRNSGTDVIGEVVYTGTDEGAVILEDLIERSNYSAAIEELKALHAAEKRRKERTIRKVEKALGLTLYDWQKDFIFYDKPYGFEVNYTRRTGKTLARCLYICLSEGEPIVATLTPPVIAKNEFLLYLGEDGSTMHRLKFFISELQRVYHILLAAGNIDLREITFNR